MSLTEKAPAHLSNEEAQAWADGYEAAIEDTLAVVARPGVSTAKTIRAGIIWLIENKRS